MGVACYQWVAAAVVGPLVAGVPRPSRCIIVTASIVPWAVIGARARIELTFHPEGKLFFTAQPVREIETVHPAWLIVKKVLLLPAGVEHATSVRRESL